MEPDIHTYTTSKLCSVMINLYMHDVATNPIDVLLEIQEVASNR